MAGEAAAGGAMADLGAVGGAFEPGTELPGAADLPPGVPTPEAGTPPEVPEPIAPAGEEGDSPLLATPGKRDGRETSGVGKSIRNKANPEAVRLKTNRSVLPGYGGHDSISTLQKGITEEVTNYKERQNLQEQRIFAISQETQQLIADLDDMESSNNEAQ